jgi:hypothetical protein
VAWWRRQVRWEDKEEEVTQGGMVATVEDHSTHAMCVRCCRAVEDEEKGKGAAETVRGNGPPVLGLFGPAEERKKMDQEGEELGRRVDRVQGG